MAKLTKPAGVIPPWRINPKAGIARGAPPVSRSTSVSGAVGATAPITPPPLDGTAAFFLDDFGRTLFPLHTNKILIERGEPEIRDYIAKCLDDGNGAYSFSAQRRVYAAKPGRYLRRTLKLDVVAEFFLYDLVYRNRNLFRKPHTPSRDHYGYRFEAGVPIAPTAAYKGFKGALSDYAGRFTHSMGFDVASYFNHVYHHDLVSWFCELGAEDGDAEALGQLLREINSGRSVDCLPQGLYPAKMIGNDFLRFVDNYHGLKSERLVRFMDDFHVFSSSEQSIADDFLTIQRLLGDKGLSVNPGKTTRNSASHVETENQIDAVRANLLARRRQVVANGYDAEGREVLERWPLDTAELEYIDNILERPGIEEEDAELLLTIMGTHARRVESRLPFILTAYPHLTKNIYSFCAGVDDKDALGEMVLAHIKGQERLMEFQLFWLAAILEAYLIGTPSAAALIAVLFEHRSATSITKARILEIPDRRFGLPELRNEFLVGGQSDWLAWSSAVGSRSLKPTSRNHRLKYFGKSSQMNHLIASIMLKG